MVARQTGEKDRITAGFLFNRGEKCGGELFDNAPVGFAGDMAHLVGRNTDDFENVKAIEFGLEDRFERVFAEENVGISRFGGERKHGDAADAFGKFGSEAMDVGDFVVFADDEFAASNGGAAASHEDENTAEDQNNQDRDWAFHGRAAIVESGFDVDDAGVFDRGNEIDAAA